MNPEQIHTLAAQGRIRWESSIGFSIDGALVVDEADHAACVRVLGMDAKNAPFMAGKLVEPAAHLIAPAPTPEQDPEPEREPMSGIIVEGITPTPVAMETHTATVDVTSDRAFFTEPESTVAAPAEVPPAVVPDEAPAVDAAREPRHRRSRGGHA